MSRINVILKALKNKGVNKYLIKEEIVESSQCFYVLQKLETKRVVETLEEVVTVYKEFEDEKGKYLGSSNFKIEHKMSIKELESAIDDALYAASFVKNPCYELVKGEKRKKVSTKCDEEIPFEVLDKIANIYINESKENVKFNSLELFYNKYLTHLINSEGVNYTKIERIINIEAIPSYKSKDLKTELYRMFKYNELDYEKISKDSKSAIDDVLIRAEAQNLKMKKQINVILKDEFIKEMFWEVISSYDYYSVFTHSNIHSIGDKVVENPQCNLNLSLNPLNKADFFDSDGVLLKGQLIIENGILKAYYGNNRFAQYLNIKPTGNLNKIKINNGKLKENDLKKEPYIELVDLSGLQVDLFADYLGGEVRLAKYFDGEKIMPISGFSFSISLKEALNSISFSKETANINGFEGPKLALIKKVNVLS